MWANFQPVLVFRGLSLTTSSNFRCCNLFPLPCHQQAFLLLLIVLLSSDPNCYLQCKNVIAFGKGKHNPYFVLWVGCPVAGKQKVLRDIAMAALYNNFSGACLLFKKLVESYDTMCWHVLEIHISFGSL